ncbi:hypothetical protein BGZ65_012901, partial [Modicella reniformis]
LDATVLTHHYLRPEERVSLEAVQELVLDYQHLLETRARQHLSTQPMARTMWCLE